MFDRPYSEFSDEAKYRYFADNYTSLIEDDINVQNTSIEGDTLHLTYELEDPDDTSTMMSEDVYIPSGYAVTGEEYIYHNHPSIDESWIPERLMVTGIDPESGEVYWTSYTTKNVMMEYLETDDFDEYHIYYLQSMEEGPAYPED